MKSQEIQPKNYQVLIVDDAEPNILLLSHVLKKEGYNILIARNGDEALVLVKNEKPDIILLDIMMPGKSGYDVIKELKSSIYKDIPVIIFKLII